MLFNARLTYSDFLSQEKFYNSLDIERITQLKNGEIPEILHQKGEKKPTIEEFCDKLYCVGYDPIEIRTPLQFIYLTRNDLQDYVIIMVVIDKQLFSL